MKDCGFPKEKLSAFLDGMVSATEKAEIDAHLSGCSACRRQLAGLQAVVRNVKKLDEVEPPVWLAQKVMNRVRAEAAPGQNLFQKIFTPFRFRIPLEAAAVVFVAVIAVYVFKSAMPDVRQGRLPEETSSSAPLTAPVSPPEERPALMRQEAVPPPRETARQVFRAEPQETSEKQAVKPVHDRAEVSADKGGYAPAPAAAVPGPTLRAREEGEPAGTAARKAESAGVASPVPAPALEKRAKKSALSAPALQESSADAAAPRPDGEFMLLAADPDRAVREVIHLTGKAAGRVTGVRQSDGMQVISVELESDRLKGFLEQLAQAGTVEQVRSAAGRTGRIVLTISIRKR